MIYEYQAADGEIITESRAMTDEHPEQIEHEGKVYNRVYGVPAIQKPKAYATTHKGEKIPVSHSLPSRDISKGKEAGGVFEYPDGLTTDQRGKPIIGNKQDAKNWASATGFQREE
jgi:hypothetical protein